MANMAMVVPALRAVVGQAVRGGALRKRFDELSPPVGNAATEVSGWWPGLARGDAFERRPIPTLGRGERIRTSGLCVPKVAEPGSMLLLAFGLLALAAYWLVRRQQ